MTGFFSSNTVRLVSPFFLRKAISKQKASCDSRLRICLITDRSGWTIAGTNATYYLDGLDLSHNSTFSVPTEYTLSKKEKMINFVKDWQKPSDRPFAETLRGDECLNSQDSVINPRCRVPFKAVFKGVLDLSKLPEKTDKFWFQVTPATRLAPQPP